MSKLKLVVEIDKDLTNGEDEVLAQFIRDGILPAGEGEWFLKVHSDEGGRQRQADGEYTLPVWATLVEVDTSIGFTEDLFLSPEHDGLVHAELLSSEHDDQVHAELYNN